MSQHDFTIANQTASSARSDINNALQALASNSSGTTAPSPSFANQYWYNPSTNILSLRNEGNNAWIPVAYIDQSNSKWEIFDDTKVVDTNGTHIGNLGDQSQSAWTAGTSTTESLFSPSKLKSWGDTFGDNLIDINGFSDDNYMELNGLLVQWTRVTFTAQENSPFSVQFPKTFSDVYVVHVSMELNTGSGMDGNLYIRSYTNSAVSCQFHHTNANNYGTGKCHIIALGEP